MRIGFTTIKVKNIEASLDFYCNFLKLEIATRFSPRPGVDIVFLKDDKNNILELIYNEHVDIDTLEKGSKISVGFKVDSLEDVLKEIQERSLNIIMGPMTIPTGEKFVFILDPNGVEIEFIEGFEL